MLPRAGTKIGPVSPILVRENLKKTYSKDNL